MAFLDWTKRLRLKQPGDRFKKGDRIVVHETFNTGPGFKRESPYGPGIVSAVHHNGTLLGYERGGRLPAHAAVEDVRHATELDTHRYSKDFSTLEAKIDRERAQENLAKSEKTTMPRTRPSWERGR